MKKTFIFSLLFLTGATALAWDTPTMGWSSWNAFGHRINEEIIRSQADAMVSKGLDKVGFKYINIDDGAWCGRNSSGHLVIHPTRFPNGLKSLVDYIHAKGLKAGTYSDAGYNTCASYWGGDKDGIGTGLYEHDQEDIDFMFKELGFDFIKVDFCGGNPIHNTDKLQLDERERYTAIGNAIKATGREDARFNVCRWDYPGTWVNDVATSWRISGDINLSWESVKDIIRQSLYISAYATEGRFNDMDMLEVGRGLSKEEDKTHFGMWCMLSSPLLLGCDLRQIDNTTLRLLTNEELIALNQDPLALQATVVNRVNGTYTLVKDVETLYGKTRAVALYNPTDEAMDMTLSFSDVLLGGEVAVRDVFENSEMGTFTESFTVNVPAHGTRIYRLEGAQRLEQTLYEAETGWIEAYQEIENNQWKETGIYEEMDICSGGAKAGWLGKSAANSLQWRNIHSFEGGEYELSIYFISGENRALTVDVNGETAATLNVNSGGWGNIGTQNMKVNLKKGDNNIRLSSTSNWMPDIDCIRLTPIGSTPGAVGDILAGEDDKANVYSLSGQCVGKMMTKKEILSLPSGIYVLRNRKILIP